MIAIHDNFALSLSLWIFKYVYTHLNAVEPQLCRTALWLTISGTKAWRSNIARSWNVTAQASTQPRTRRAPEIAKRSSSTCSWSCVVIPAFISWVVHSRVIPRSSPLCLKEDPAPSSKLQLSVNQWECCMRQLSPDRVQSTPPRLGMLLAQPWSKYYLVTLGSSRCHILKAIECANSKAANKFVRFFSQSAPQ